MVKHFLFRNTGSIRSPSAGTHARNGTRYPPTRATSATVLRARRLRDPRPARQRGHARAVHATKYYWGGRWWWWRRRRCRRRRCRRCRRSRRWRWQRCWRWSADTGARKLVPARADLCHHDWHRQGHRDVRVIPRPRECLQCKSRRSRATASDSVARSLYRHGERAHRPDVYVQNHAGGAPLRTLRHGAHPWSGAVQLAGWAPARVHRQSQARAACLGTHPDCEMKWTRGCARVAGKVEGQNLQLSPTLPLVCLATVYRRAVGTR